MARFAATADGVRNFVGIEDIGATRRECGRHGGLAAADTPGESNQVGPRQKYQPLISAGPKKRAIAPAIAR